MSKLTWLEPFAENPLAHDFARAHQQGENDGSVIAATKWEAERRILARFPLYKQINATAAVIELLEVRPSQDGVLTAEQEAIASYGREMKAWITAVREHSDVLEAAGKSPFDANAGWPE